MPQLRIDEAAMALIQPVLDTEPALTFKLAGLLRRNDIQDLRVDNVDEPTTVMVKCGGFYTFFGLDVDAAIGLLDEVPWDQEPVFAGVWEPLTELVAERVNIKWQNPCYQYFLADGESEFDSLMKLGGAIDKIEEATDDVVTRILEAWPYGDPNVQADRDHVVERIESGLTAGWYEDGELVAWAMTAADSSIGYLNTLEAHRNKGIGAAVAASLCLKVWGRELTPYCYVVSDNEAPNSILKKLGFERSQDRFVWFGTSVA